MSCWSAALEAPFSAISSSCSRAAVANSPRSSASLRRNDLSYKGTQMVVEHDEFLTSVNFIIYTALLSIIGTVNCIFNNIHTLSSNVRVEYDTYLCKLSTDGATLAAHTLLSFCSSSLESST